MAFRIITILALLVAIGGGVVNELGVQARVSKLDNDLATTTKNKQQQIAARTDATNKLSDTNNVLRATQTALDTARQNLTQKTQEVGATQGELQRSQQAEQKAKKDLADTHKSDEEYKEFAMPIKDIVYLQTTLPARQKELASTQKELDLVTKDNSRLKGEIARIRPKDLPPAMPSGLVGSVVAADPKYQYVILNVGQSQGVVTNGVMLVDRDGEFLGKVRIMKVEEDHSIANILQDWKQGDIVEGDKVVYKDL